MKKEGRQGYEFYIGPATGSKGRPLLLPVAPKKLTVKVKNRNKTVELMNDGEVNLLKSPGLTEIEFEALLPNTKYPFAEYENGFQNAKAYLDRLEELKAGKKTFQFIVSRMLPDGSILFSTNITCSLEEYSVEEDAEDNGTDILVSVSLKQYRPYGVKKCKVKTKKYISLKKLRNKKFYNLPETSDGLIQIVSRGGTEYTVIKIKKAITLYNLAKKIYGDGNLYTLIVPENVDISRKYARAKNSAKNPGFTKMESLTERERRASSWKKSKKLKKGTMVTIPLSYYS